MCVFVCLVGLFGLVGSLVVCRMRVCLFALAVLFVCFVCLLAVPVCLFCLFCWCVCSVCVVCLCVLCGVIVCLSDCPAGLAGLLVWLGWLV